MAIKAMNLPNSDSRALPSVAEMPASSILRGIDHPAFLPGVYGSSSVMKHDSQPRIGQQLLQELTST